MESNQAAVIAILALLVVAAGILWLLYRSRRTAALRERFGAEEYDRTVDRAGSRSKAENDLLEREKRVAALNLRPLEPAERQRFSEEWSSAKAAFVDDPQGSVPAADRVIGDVMGARGFPVDDFDARFESLSVDHGQVARHYRAGHDIALKQASGQATTEELRQAMIHYEALFDELVKEAPPAPDEAVSRQAQRA